MTVVDPANLAPHLSEEDVWNLVNTMPVTFQDFAVMSSYYARLYDVLTGAVEGGKWDALTVNSCLRDSLWRKLLEIVTDTENRVGYNLSARYHFYEIDFPEFGKVVTRWPGISAMSVKPSWTTPAGYGPFPISAIAVADATVQTPETQPIVEADASIFENPADTQMRNGTTNNTYLPLNIATYPKLVGNNWEIPIDVKRSSFDKDEPVALQHRKHLILDVDPPAPGVVPTGGTLHPVYPGTNQVIPQARPARVLDSGKVRYTFFIYTLVHPAFKYETINLEQGQFYKLYPTIEFKILSEVPAQAQVAWKKGGTTQTINVTLDIARESEGTFHVVFADEVLVDPMALWESMECAEQWTPETVKLRYWYKTDPNKLDEHYRNQIPAFRTAICHRVAAELAVLDCGCELKSGFIYENQQRYNKITMRPYTGPEIKSAEFADSYGRLRYEDILASQFTKTPLVLI